MRIEGTVYQNLDQYKNQAGRQALREGADYGSAARERPYSLTDDLLKSRQALLEKQWEEEKESSFLFEREKDAESQLALLKKFEEAVREMNDAAEINYVSLRFQLHEDSQRWMVRIIDIMEDEVVRVIPPEELLNLAGRIQKLAGVLLDTQR